MKERTTKAKKIQDVGVGCIFVSGRYLIAKRSKRRGGLWEFPGGKREKGERLRDCLKREILEEIGVRVSVSAPFHVEETHINGAAFRLYFCRCRLLQGKPKKTEHTALRWVTPAEFKRYALPKANARALRLLKRYQSTFLTGLRVPVRK